MNKAERQSATGQPAAITLEMFYRGTLANMAMFLFMAAMALVTMQTEPIIAAAVTCFICDVAVAVLTHLGRWVK